MDFKGQDVHPLLLKRHEAADKLGVSIATFDRLRYAKRIKEVRISPHRVGFREADLEEYIEYCSMYPS
ncbi:MAG: helix-turn-helix domain-containing protein [Ktedonobacteraceae bacterium]